MPSFWCTLSTAPHLPLRQLDVIARGKVYVMTSLFFAVNVLVMLKYNSHRRSLSARARVSTRSCCSVLRALVSDSDDRQGFYCGRAARAFKKLRV